MNEYFKLGFIVREKMLRAFSSTVTCNKYIIIYGGKYKTLSMYAKGWHGSAARPKGSCSGMCYGHGPPSLAWM